MNVDKAKLNEVFGSFYIRIGSEVLANRVSYDSRRHQILPWYSILSFFLFPGSLIF